MLRLKPFELHEPATVGEAVDLLGRTPGAVVMSGGTDFVPKIKRRQFDPPAVISLARISDLARIVQHDDRLEIGAFATLAALEASEEVRPFTALFQAVRAVATPIIRHSATIGGNLLQDTRCRYYDRSFFWRDAVGFCLKKDGDACLVAPGADKCFATLCSDVAPALAVLDAEVTLKGKRERTVALEALYRDDGMDHLDVKDEILVRVTIPSPTLPSSYRKVRMRDSFDFPEAGVAVAVDLSGDTVRARVAVTGVSPGICVAKESFPSSEIEAFVDRVHARIKPMDTLFFSPAYRKAVVRNLLAQQLHELLASR